jgi:hypothetical protein
MTYSIPLKTDVPMSEQVARALSEYIAKNGNPPPMTESISVLVDGEWIVIDLFSMKETK